MNRKTLHTVAALIALTAGSAGLARTARADILFIDLDNSPLEIAQAQKAAEARGEQLVVIPTRAWMNQTNPPQLLNAANLSTLIQSAIKNLKPGDSFDSLVLSGEHEANNFFGANGEFSKVQLGQILSSTPALTSTLRSVYGWGCYDSSQEMAMWIWPFIPHLEVVAGFDGESPSNTRAQDLSYLYGALTSEKKLTQALQEKEDTNQIDAVIKAIPGFNQNNSVVYTDAACYSHTYGDIDPSTMAQCSEQVDDTLVDAAHDFWPMIYAPAQSEPVPCDTSNSWLRTYYDSLRDHDYCANTPGPNQTSFIGTTASEAQVIRMVYFQNVVQHFVRANSSDLQKLSAIAAKQPGFPSLNLSAGASCGAQAGNSRQQILAWISQLAGAESSLSPSDQTFLKSLLSKMNTQIVNLNCVPSTWLDPINKQEPEEQSSCPAS